METRYEISGNTALKRELRWARHMERVNRRRSIRERRQHELDKALHSITSESTMTEVREVVGFMAELVFMLFSGIMLAFLAM